MPAGVVKPGTEAKWEEAKKSVRKSYPNKTGDSFWAIVNSVYGKMIHRNEATARMESAKSAIDIKNRTSDPDSVADVDKWLKDTETERLAADGKGGYLVTEADGTKHLPTRKNGKPDHGLMGGAWAALHGGYRGNKYDGPGKQAAISKLKALYKSQGLKTPDQKESAAARAYQTFRWMFGRAAAEEVKKALASERMAAAQTVPRTATCAVAIAYAEGDTGVPEWVELIPGGKFSAVDGRGPFKNENPEKIIAASLARMPQVGLVLDYDHSTDLAAPEGRQSPAAGWIKDFKVSDRGAIFARIEWTKRAAELLKDKEYRYISPVFEHDNDNKVECVLRAALTNNPALIELPALAAARTQAMPKKEDMSLSEKMRRFEAALPPREAEDMNAYHKRLMRHAAMDLQMPDDSEEESAGALGDWAKEEEAEPEHRGSVGEEADEEMSEEEAESDNPPDTPYHPETEEDMARRHADEMARCAGEDEENACRMRHMAEKKRFEARKNQGLEVEAGRHGVTETKDDEDDEAMHSRMARRREDMRARMSRRPTLTKSQIDSMVAKHPMMLSLQSEFNKLRQEKAKDAAVKKVDEAIRQGRLIPAQRAWAITYCTIDEKGFGTFIGAQPKIIQAGADGTFTARIGEPPKGASSLTEHEVSIFANLGLETEEQLAKCAAVKDKWTLRFPRPRLMLDDNATAQNNEK